MTRRRAPIIAAVVLVVVVAFIIVLAGSDPDGRPASPSPLLGRQAPEIVGLTVGGVGFDLGEQRGRFVVVNFFATWCTPCIREHPELVEFEQRQGAEGATVISVVYDDRADDVAGFFEDNGGDWPVVLDPDGRTALSYGVSGIPESYVVGPDGTVVAKLIGGVTADDLVRVVTEAREVIG